MTDPSKIRAITPTKMEDENMANPSMTATAMTEALSRFLDVDVARYKLISTNIANIDTPGYHTRDLDFRAELQRAAAEDSETESGQLVSASSNPVAHKVRGLMERPDGNNVSIERESLLLAEAQMKFNLGVQLLKDQFHLISTAINSGGATS
jgi:flagellar basal-body rod protein FlgB